MDETVLAAEHVQQDAWTGTDRSSERTQRHAGEAVLGGVLQELDDELALTRGVGFSIRVRWLAQPLTDHGTIVTWPSGMPVHPGQPPSTPARSGIVLDPEDRLSVDGPGR
jgi:hypothetical protein